MKATRYLLIAVIAAVAMLVPKPASAITLGEIISLLAPPAIPTSSYTQPAPPAPNSMWIPGYWQWNGNSYNWIAGRWTYAPSPGQYWTPSYWASTPAGYVYHSGYWGNSVGYYGNVDYGHGYFGKGYDGGKWQGRTFQYNSYITHINPGTVHQVYYNRNVYMRSPQQNRQSFYGPPRAVNHGHSAMQTNHGKPAMQANHGRPAMQANHGHPAAKQSGHGKPPAGKQGGNQGGKGGGGHGKPPR